MISFDLPNGGTLYFSRDYFRDEKVQAIVTALRITIWKREEIQPGDNARVSYVALPDGQEPTEDTK